MAFATCASTIARSSSFCCIVNRSHISCVGFFGGSGVSTGTHDPGDIIQCGRLPDGARYLIIGAAAGRAPHSHNRFEIKRKYSTGMISGAPALPCGNATSIHKKHSSGTSGSQFSRSGNSSVSTVLPDSYIPEGGDKAFDLAPGALRRVLKDPVVADRDVPLGVGVAFPAEVDFADPVHPNALVGVAFQNEADTVADEVMPQPLPGGVGGAEIVGSDHVRQAVDDPDFPRAEIPCGPSPGHPHHQRRDGERFVGPGLEVFE